jgi:hypothetical protein
MIEKVIKTKVLHYRQAKFLKPGGNLENMIGAALEKLSLVEQRLEHLVGDDYRLVNDSLQSMAMIFGNLMTFEEGTNKLLLDVDRKVKSLNVRQLPPPSIGGKKSEFLDSVLYYGVKQNHVILMQSAGLKTKQFEQHINWLLREAKIIDTDDYVTLDDSPKPEAKKQLAKAHVKSVNIISPLSTSEGYDPTETKVSNTKRLDVTPKGRAFDILKSLLGESEFKKLPLSEALDANLKVSVSVTYSRTTTETGQRALDSIANLLRHMDEDDVAIEVPGIGILRGSDLKLSENINVETFAGNVSQKDLFPKMHDWLKRLVEQRLIVIDTDTQ